MRTFLLLIAVCLSYSVSSYAQSLSAGDIAFIGYNTDGTDDFAWIALTDIPAGEIIYFTEEGWNDVTSGWAGTTEGHMTYTAPAGGIVCGTIVHIDETSADVFTVTGGGTAVIATGSWSLASGDQVIAYYATMPEPAIVPTFLAGVHGDDGNGTPLTLNPTNFWNDAELTALGTARSELPPGLTNGVNCVSLFPAVGTELDNAKYTGTLTGTTTVLRALINDQSNWSKDDITPYSIAPGDFSPSVTCVTPTPEIDIEGNAISIADGDVTASLTDDTDFGTFAISATGTNTFTIQNEGTATLNLSGGPNYVTVSGGAGFVVVTQPSGTVAAAGSTTFQIQFTASCGDPLSQTATVSVSSDDSDESPYTFTIAASISGADTDGDGVVNACDTDDDNDGVVDALDPDDANFNICGDSDGDGCDDCSITVDGFGSLSDSDPSNDGPDEDCDGICDATDPVNDAQLARGNMMQFSGGQYLSIGDVPALNFGEHDVFTIEGWINTATGGDIDIISKYGGITGTGWVFQHSTANNSLAFLMQGGLLDMFISGPSGAPAVADGLWHHVAVSYDGSNAATGCTFYIDGIAYAGVAVSGFTGPIGGTVANGHGATIGAYEDNGPAEYWNGAMDEIRVWNVVRNQDDIRLYRHLTMAGGCDGSIVGYWKFNETSGTVSADLSSSGNDASHVGGPVIASSQASVGYGVSSSHNAVSTGVNYLTPSLYTGHDLSLNFGSVAPGGEIVVTYIAELPVNGVPSGALANYRLDHWIVDNYGPNNAALNCTAHFDYQDGGVTTVSLASYCLHKRGSNDTGAWALNNSFADAASTVPGSNYIEFGSINDFSMLFPSSGTSPLPVELVSFTASLQGENNALLQWKTLSEENCEGYRIEHSIDLDSWEAIGFVEGAGNSSSALDYDFLHRNLSEGTHYYRLIQIDIDHTETESDIASLLVRSSGEHLMVVPNPASDNIYIVSVEDLESIEVLDMAGRRMSVDADPEQKRAAISGLSSGYYVAMVRTTSGMVKKIPFLVAE